MSQDTTNDEGREKIAAIIKNTRIASLTHVDGQGRLLSKPMATQDVDFDGTVYFIAARNSDQVQAMQQNPAVNVAYSGKGEWVSLVGTARIEDDRQKLEELWGTFTDAFMDGGPEDPNNILIVVDGDTAEYWESPGSSTIMRVAAFAKGLAGGTRPEGDNEVVDLTSPARRNRTLQHPVSAVDGSRVPHVAETARSNVRSRR
ncbi:MAG: pyridoxamine 5'-phosphate oxidase family protein [Mobilicoccus sp.]|nr:pyridoxamine 5'-phosphate oxidase family protein [Mobilicoccus sp.]